MMQPASNRFGLIIRLFTRLLWVNHARRYYYGPADGHQDAQHDGRSHVEPASPPESEERDPEDTAANDDKADGDWFHKFIPAGIRRDI